MSDFEQILSTTRRSLREQFEKATDKASVLRARELRDLYAAVAKEPAEMRSELGRKVNELKSELGQLLIDWQESQAKETRGPIDITAPQAENTPDDKKPKLLSVELGSIHPVSRELKTMTDIFYRMGFEVVESRQIDDEYHMFGSLNFPPDHPARDDYDTFLTDEGLVLPAHTSTMQNRILKAKQPPIFAVIPGRVFRNEDLDAQHEHTFHQLEGVVVDEGISLGDMLGTLSAFLESYFGEKLEYKTQPFYFPFVEPGLEYLVKTPMSLQGNIKDEWIELIGCGMIHPNVLREAGIDSTKYSGFAWGLGIDRMIMLKYGIEDVRHFMSAKLEFLRQFGGSK